MSSPPDPMLHQLREALASLFGRLQTAVAPPSKRAVALGVAPAPGPDGFPPALLEQLRKSGSVLAGRVQLIGLEKIRERLGRRWEDKRDQVISLVGQIIAKHMAEPDYWRLVGDASFLIVFAKAGKAEAELRTAAILDSILRALPGEGKPFEEVQVRTLVVEVDGRVAFREVDAIAILTKALEEEERASQHATPVPAGVNPLLPPSLVFRYRPIWQVRANAVNTYHCIAEAAMPDGRLARDYNVLPGGARSSLTAELDLRALRQAMADLGDLSIGAGAAMPMVAVTVHCHTLETPATRQVYMRVCGEIPAAIRPFLVFEIAALPSFAPESRIHNFAMLLAPFSRGLVLRIKEPQYYPSSLRALGITSVSWSADDAGVAESAAYEALTKFYSTALPSGCATVAHGLGSTRLIAAALAGGYDFVDGDALLPLRSKPTLSEGYSLQDFERNVSKLASARRQRAKDAP